MDWLDILCNMVHSPRRHILLPLVGLFCRYVLRLTPLRITQNVNPDSLRFYDGWVAMWVPAGYQITITLGPDELVRVRPDGQGLEPAKEGS